MCVSTTILAGSKIVQIEKKEEEDVKEEIVTQMIMIQRSGSDDRLEINKTADRSWRNRI